MKVLLADDHPSILLAFEAMLISSLEEKGLEFSKCLSCKETYFAIENKLSESKAFDLALVDFRMPSYPEQDMNSGADLCRYIKNTMPNCKVFIITSVIDNVALFDIFQNAKPDGIAIKSDLTPDSFPLIIEAILNDKKYRSETVVTKIEEVWETDLFVQPINRKLLYYISQGYRIKEMSEELCISEGAIHKRIAKIKVALNVSEDSSILREAKKRGFV